MRLHELGVGIVGLRLGDGRKQLRGSCHVGTVGEHVVLAHEPQRGGRLGVLTDEGEGCLLLLGKGGVRLFHAPFGEQLVGLVAAVYLLLAYHGGVAVDGHFVAGGDEDGNRREVGVHHGERATVVYLLLVLEASAHHLDGVHALDDAVGGIDEEGGLVHVEQATGDLHLVAAAGARRKQQKNSQSNEVCC